MIQMTFSEALLLSLAGTLVGIAVGGALLNWLKFQAAASGASGGRIAAMVVDGNVITFAGCLCLVAALVAGLPPALAALRLSVSNLLQSETRGAAGSATRHRWLRGLIVTQIAGAFVLANVAVLFSASYANVIKANAQRAMAGG